MGHIFSIKNSKPSNTKAPTPDWSNAGSTTYNDGYVKAIKDSTTKQKEITSIPSPFARIELVKAAFDKVCPENSNASVEETREMLHGDSIYHKIVSDTLDVAQIFFNYPSMKDNVEIIVWDKDRDLGALLNSKNQNHKVAGRTLDMFFKQDGEGKDPYNFKKMKNLYILRYKGPGRKQMHIIGATSPATLFFSTANDDSSLANNLCFGTDKAFDGDYCSLDNRDPEFIKYLFAYRYSYQWQDPENQDNVQNFGECFPELERYLNAVYNVIDDNLKQMIDDIESACYSTSDNQSFIDKEYEKYDVGTGDNVEINGNYFHCKTVKISGNSDFEILDQKDNEVKPLVLPVTKGNAFEKLEYYGSPFGREINVPYADKADMFLRKLPGINIQHPYITISDFLDDKIVKLPASINKQDYFDGNFKSTNGQEEGYLLPVKDMFFQYFHSDYLLGLSPSGKKAIEINQLSAGVEVALRIPIKGGEVEYKRIYTNDVKADEENNKGAIVVPDEDLAVGVFPPVKFAIESDAHYRIIIMSDFDVNKESSCVCYSNANGSFVPDFVERNVDIQDDLSSKVYLLDGTSFDFARLTLVAKDGKERIGNGILIPRFKLRSGSASLTFAIDFGTSNTHIEYSAGDNELPKPFEFGKEQAQLSLLFNTDSASVMDHLRSEFIPETIGAQGKCHFPMRTVLCIDKVNNGHNASGNGSYEPFGNASPAFMYNQKVVGTKYNDFIPNLKWSEANPLNEQRIRCFIESLFMMMRTKVVQEGASIQQTKIKWFYPISMSVFKKSLFERIWNDAYKKFFNPSGEPIAITESVAPYSFFQKTMATVSNIVTIDIGGGTTDIVVADSTGVKCVTSMRFAADAIFGNSLVAVQNGELNGIIKQCKDEFIANLKGVPELQDMLKQKTANNYGNSSEVASFLFSLADNENIKNNHMSELVDFNAYLMRNSSQKIVFYIFFTSIMYHLAHLMHAKGLEVPANIAFSGNGSKVVSVLSPSAKTLGKLTTHIFRLIYNQDISKDINLIINTENPKEITCKGGLFLETEPADLDSAKSILLDVASEELTSTQCYSDALNMFDKVEQDAQSFINFIALKMNRIQGYSISNEFGLDSKYIQLVIKCFNENLKTYVEKGVRLKLDTKDVNKDDKLDEPLFFYPIIGIINDLSNRVLENDNQ